jgi:hypothetical protein
MPNYYLITDPRQIDQYRKEISELPIKYRFVGFRGFNFWQTSLSDGCIGFVVEEKKYTSEMPPFSTDFTKSLIEGYTVTYAAIQLAAYMGFLNIYLLGVDFDYSGDTSKGENHFIKSYMKEGEVFQATDENKALLAYQKAEQFSREHGFRIYNATRGGKLEVFERVDFDSLFE